MNKEYYLKNHEKILQRTHDYKMRNKDKIKEYNKKYYEKTRKDRDTKRRLATALDTILRIMQERNSSLVQMGVSATDKSGKKYKYGRIIVYLEEKKVEK